MTYTRKSYWTIVSVFMLGALALTLVMTIFEMGQLGTLTGWDKLGPFAYIGLMAFGIAHLVGTDPVHWSPIVKVLDEALKREEQLKKGTS